MKKIVLVYNPVSGDALLKYRLDDIIYSFMKRDYMVLPYRTQAEHNAEKFAEFMADVEAEGIMIAGGDGTLNEMVNCIIKYDIDLPIGILPAGTSNDFAEFLHINTDIDKYIETVCQGWVMPIDVGRVGDKYFVNVASAGVMTSVAHRVDAGLKNALGKMAYYLKGLTEIPAFHALNMTIQADDKVYREKAFLFVITNSSVVGSLKNVAVNAKIDDGLLDMIVLKQCKVPELMTLVVELFAGKNVTTRSDVLYIQARNIRIECEQALESDLDGELGPRLPLDITTVHGRIKLFYKQDN